MFIIRYTLPKISDFDYSRKNLWNKCDNKTLSFHDSSIFDAFEKEKLKNGKHSKINNSTLSLHISAYENLIEALGDSNGSENEGMKEKKIQTNFTDSVSLLQNRFEFPRQQENQEIEPEIMQFKTSQRLLNPNLFGREPALNSVKMDDLTFGIEEELELDYEAEEARKAKEIAAARTSGSLDDNDQEDGEEGKIEGDNDGEEEEFEKSVSLLLLDYVSIDVT
uniref:Uncharacterized protein n=1 Tax=Panagrolaimus sp. ES5 TaxID=591445 RepID=A0AC34F4J1_9BILA